MIRSTASSERFCGEPSSSLDLLRPPCFGGVPEEHEREESKAKPPELRLELVGAGTPTDGLCDEAEHCEQEEDCLNGWIHEWTSLKRCHTLPRQRPLAEQRMTLMGHTEFMGTREELEAEMIPEKEPVTERFFQRWIEPILVILVLGLFVGMIVGATLLDKQNDEVVELQTTIDEMKAFQSQIREAQRAAEQRGYKLRALDCQLLIYDDDRAGPITNDCTEAPILGYYPPQVCALLRAPISCGHKFEASRYQTPVPEG